MNNPVETLRKLKQKAVFDNIRKWTADTRIYVGMATCEMAAGSREVMETIRSEIRKRRIRSVSLEQKGCVGRCSLEPTVEVLQAGKSPFKYVNVDRAMARKIVLDHLVRNNVPSAAGTAGDRPVSHDALTDKSRFVFGDLPYFDKQKRMTLRNCGIINPESLDDYLIVRGYEALAKVLAEYTPDRVIDEITKAGLRGRGGGGFPTGAKWRFVANEKSDMKYVICNADEGDPGAFMDRSTIEGDPFSIVEAMSIGGFAVGATRGIVYIRAEYPLAVERLKIAIRKARENNLLGRNILGSNFSFDIDLVLGAGAFVCGEETALIHSIEGYRGMPRTRPPYPSVSGLWGKPTLINNVETWANIPVIILDGWQYFASTGTPKSKGTKVFALAGKVNNTGLIEVEMGIPLGDIIFDIGGGIKNGKKFKAAQTGGPSGGCLPVQFLNTPIDYDSLVSAGSIMGSGGLIVMDETDCMVDVAKFFLEFTQEESCGKCTPCREGTKRMLEILERITSGRGEEGDIEKLECLGNTIKKTALCGLGQTAPNPVLSTIKYFRHEYEAHIRNRKCPSAVCGELFVSPCQHTCPVNIDIPAFIGKIRDGRPGDSLAEILKRNPLPSVCGRVCHHPCENHCRRSKIDQSVSIMFLKRFASDYAGADRIPLETWRGPRPYEPVAVVGAGPSGLTCAYHLAKRGYRVTVFEAEKKAGGMLTYGIPPYRLPRGAVARDINRIEKAGVKIRFNKALGRDFTLAGLEKQGFKAIFLAIGAWQEMPLNIPGADLPGCLGSLSFLKQFNTGRVNESGGIYSIEENGRKLVVTGSSVAVIGGGNAAIDVARTCLRLGAAEVNVVYRRTRESMPAIREEIDEAENEGVRFHFLLAPSAVLGRNGRTAGLECLRCRMGEFDLSGRRKAVTSGEKVLFESSIVIAAVGSGAKVPPGIGELERRDNGAIRVNPLTMQTSRSNVFAGGDAATGVGTVIGAMAEGEQAAVSIDRLLRGKPLETERFVVKGRRKEVPGIDPSQEVEKTPRSVPARISPARSRKSFSEVEKGFSRALALREACRCLRCDRKESEELT